MRGGATALVVVGIALGAAAPAGAALTFSRTDYPVPSLVGPPPRPAQPQGGGINTVALVDLNKDGKLDIVVADTGTGSVDVYLNQGGGAFAASPGNPYPACGNNFDAQDIVAGQLNPQTDQNPDVAVICGSDGTIVRLLGNGLGALGAPETFLGAPQSAGSGLKLAHLSGASSVDYLFGGPYNDACFIPVTATPGAGAGAAEQCDDVHSDGTPLVNPGVPVHFYDGPCSGGDQVVYFSGIGTFAAWDLDPRTGGGPGLNPCAAPFQGSTFRSSGIASPNNNAAMTAGDLNGDGEPDVVMADSAGGIHVVGWQAASTTFDGGIPPGETPFSFASVGPINALGIADFSGGGCPAIAAVENTETLVGNDYIERNFVAIHSGHCNVTQFDAAQTFDVGAGPSGYTQDPSMVVGDLNGDGKPDIVTAGGYGPNAAVTVLLNSTPASTGGGTGGTGGGTGGTGGGTGGTGGGTGGTGGGTGGTGGGTGGTGGGKSASVQFAGSPNATGTGVTFKLHCSAPTGQNCQTTEALTTTETLKGGQPIAVSAAHKPTKLKRTVVVGQKGVTISAGSAKTITMMLNSQGLKLLQRFHAVPVTLTIKLSSNGRTIESIKRTLIVKQKRRKHPQVLDWHMFEPRPAALTFPGNGMQAA
jgi:hypothetical protein